jgi:hypothetical protein
MDPKRVFIEEMKVLDAINPILYLFPRPSILPGQHYI